MNLYTYKITSIEKVVDGDTVYVTVDTGFYSSMFVKVRLDGYDTPELNSSILEEREEAKHFKNLVEDWFNSCIANGLSFYLESKRQGKYGRWVGKIITQDATGNWFSLNEFMKEKLAE
jgi:micrococcal nuclease